MEIVIIRQPGKPWGVDGHLYINRQRVCDTVEHPTLHRPQGEYLLEFKTLPFRHGDGALGCKNGEIIVGTTALPGMVTESQAIYGRLYDRLKKTFQRGKPVKLRIWDAR